MEDEKMDEYMMKTGVLGRRLMELQKALSDVAWAYDGLVIEYAQARQKDEQEKQKKAKENKEKQKKAEEEKKT